ncbi:MAG: fatty acid desaturase [Bdellovibrionales bacterium]|nr:fatty acid desaturase [Bdellovibrionales bacterium]
MRPESFGTNTDVGSHKEHEIVSKKIDWTNTIFLLSTPIIAFVLGLKYFYAFGLEWPQIALAVFFYFITGLSVTGGYHRLFAHRTYKANNFVKLIYLLFGAASFQNSALKWCSDHRVHHNHVDHDKDPYNINKGFFYAHMGWIFYKEEDSNPKYPKDLTNDKLVMWQHRNYLWLCVAMGFILPTVIGHFLGSALGGFALSGVGRVVVVHHCTFFINSLCHIVGTRPYTDSNTARDSAIMAVFSYGEGYHNYHHYFPVDYRNGIRWYHFDPTKWLIKVLSFVGWTKDLKKVPEKLIADAQLQMRIKKYAA